MCEMMSEMHECLPAVRLMCAPMNLMLDKTYSTGVCVQGCVWSFVQLKQGCEADSSNLNVAAALQMP